MAAQATCGVLVKFTPEELADIDRVCARTGEKRTTFIKRFMAAVVRRIEEQEAGDAAL